MSNQLASHEPIPTDPLEITSTAMTVMTILLLSLLTMDSLCNVGMEEVQS